MLAPSREQHVDIVSWFQAIHRIRCRRLRDSTSTSSRSSTGMFLRITKEAGQLTFAEQVPIPSYFRSELEPIIRSKETAHELYRQCTQHCRYENCKLQIERIWNLCSRDWDNLPSSVQMFYIREFGRIKSIVKWTNLAIDQGFFRPHDRQHHGRRMIGIDAAASLLLVSSLFTLRLNFLRHKG